MKKILFLTHFATLFTLSVFSQPCVDGFSGPFDCDKVDQLSLVTLETLGTSLANDIWGWTSPETGREYAIVCMFNGTAFVDVTTPDLPLYIGFLPTATSDILWRDAKVIDHYVYIVAEAAMHGMQVFDLTRLESQVAENIPVVFDEDAYYGGFGNAHNIVADTASKYVYAVGTSTFAGGLHIVDVSDPLNPSYAGSSEEDGYTHDAQVLVYNGPDADYQGKQICFASNANTITIFDVTDKQNVEIISFGMYDMTGYTHQCWLTPDHKYLLVNDELDELNFDVNTRTIVFDVQDLDNPFVIGDVDLGTTSIDHNLYTHNGLAYLSNYTSGLRILSLTDVAQGDLLPTAHFDVFVGGQPRVFQGSWSNYPYFESGTVIATGMGNGLHVLKPRLLDLPFDQYFVEVCPGGGAASMIFDMNVPVNDGVSFAVEFDGPSTTPFTIQTPTAAQAPLSNSVIFTDPSNLPAGYHTGKLTATWSQGQLEQPFVIAVGGEAPAAAPVPVFPIDGQVLGNQMIAYNWQDEMPGYGTLEVALDSEFEQMVYTQEFFASDLNFAGSLVAPVPFDLTVYYWRIVKESPCGEDALVSETATFEVGLVTSTRDRATRQSEMTIYPNPTTDQVSVRTPLPVEVIHVYDLAGKKVAEWQPRSAQNVGTYPVSQLGKGVYIAISSEGAYRSKFVVQ